jgi:hypothetical protein
MKRLHYTVETFNNIIFARAVLVKNVNEVITEAAPFERNVRTATPGHRNPVVLPFARLSKAGLASVLRLEMIP